MMVNENATMGRGRREWRGDKDKEGGRRASFWLISPRDVKDSEPERRVHLSCGCRHKDQPLSLVGVSRGGINQSRYHPTCTMTIVRISSGEKYW